MRLLVTGGAGFIGSAVVRRAVDAGHTVLNVDKLTYAANPASVSAVSANPRYSFLKADICDRETVRSALNDFEPDVLLNLAAETHVDKSIDAPDTFVKTNIEGVHSLLEACRSWLDSGGEGSRFKFVQVSTDEVYGSIASGTFNEASPYKPSSPYSASKAAGDHLVRAWTDTFGFPGIVTNCSNNYGAWQFPEKFIPTIILKALLGEKIPVYGDGQQVRDWLFVDDHAEGLLRVAEDGEVGETYCMGGGNTVANIDLARSVCSLLDKRFGDTRNAPFADLISFVADRPGHDQRYAIDHAKISRELGWTPKHDFAQGLEMTVDWYLKQSDWLKALSGSGVAGRRQGQLRRQDA